MKTLFKFLFVLLSISSTNSQPQINNISLGKQTPISLDSAQKLSAQYRLHISKDDLPEKSQKWYLFVMTEPSVNSDFSGRPSQIQIRSEEKGVDTKLLKRCKIQEESDSCFLKNNQFNYEKQNLLITVTCTQECEFGLMAEVDSSSKLKPNQVLQLDFQNTAYSKIFTFNTSGLDFDELRIILKPQFFLSYPEPIELLANFGTQIPSRQKYDMQGMHLWDDGQGIFLHKKNMKNPFITLLVEGPEKNILILSNELKKVKEQHELKQSQPYFDYVQVDETRIYLLEFTENGKVPSFPFYLRVQTYSGAVQSQQLVKIEDDMKQIVDLPDPVEKFGFFQYRFSPQFIKKHNLYKAEFVIIGVKESTYLIHFYRQTQNASLLLPMLSKSSIIEKNQKDQYLLKIHEIIDKTEDQKHVFTVEVRIGHIKGNLSFSFYSCEEEDPENCYIDEDNSLINEYEEQGVQQTHDEFIHYFLIRRKEFKREGTSDIGVFKLLVLVENNGQEGSYEIYYKNVDRMHILQEKKEVTDRIEMNEVKLYKYSNKDDDVNEIRVHVTMISGLIEFKGSFVDPRKQKVAIVYEEPTKQILHFKKNNMNRNIFVRVEGIENAYYSITLQLIRNSEKDHKDKDNKGYNELVLKEGIPYEFIISPKEKMVFQLRPSQTQFIFHFFSSLQLELCFTEKIKSPPFRGNCEVLLQKKTKISSKIVLEEGKVVNLGVHNKNDKNVTFRMGMSSAEAICFRGQLGNPMRKEIRPDGTDGGGSKTHCLAFLLNKFQDLEVVVSFRNHKYSNGSIALVLGQQIIKMASPVHRIEKEELKILCKNKLNPKRKKYFCFMEVVIQNISDTEITVVAQYMNEQIYLIDGIGHKTQGLMKINEPRKFMYFLENNVNTTVFIETILGSYKVYGKITNHTNINNAKKKKDDKFYPSEDDNQFMLANHFFDLEQVYVLDEKTIQQKCGQSPQCVLMLVVQLKGNDEVRPNGQFILECTQENRILEEDKSVSGYLDKESAAFYLFHNIQNGTLIININDQHKRCLNIFVKEGDEKRATSSDYSAKQNYAEQLIYAQARNETAYSITLQAIEHCPYTVEVSTVKNKVVKVKKGKYVDINLNINETSHLLFQNLINETFKIICAHKSGEVMISVKAINPRDLDQTLEKNIDKMNDWKWKGVDLVRIDNVDKNGKPYKNYCSDCFYLIHIQAKRQTKGSILIPTPGVQIPIATNFLIKDVLLDQEKIVYRIYTETSARFELGIQYGELNLSIVDSDSNKTTFSKPFKGRKDLYEEDFNLTKNKDYEYRKYSRVILIARMDTQFSFQIITDKTEPKKDNHLKYGIPFYLYLDKDKAKCVNGLTQGKDKFLVSYSGTDKRLVDKVNITLKINKQQITIIKEPAVNELVIKPGQSFNEKKDFELCLTSPENLGVTVIQSSPVIYFPEKQKIFVEKEVNLTFGARGKSIMEINECGGKALTSVSSEFNNLQSLSSQIKQNKKSQAIVEFYYFGPLFINTKMERGTVRWFSYDSKEGVGTGYDDYSNGWLRVNKVNGKIKVSASPIKKTNDRALSSILNTTYTFYTGKQDYDLSLAMNCFSANPRKNILRSGSTNTSISANFAINQLKSAFGKYNYFLVGLKAQVTLQNAKKDIEKYRFYYPYQEVPKQLLEESNPVIDPVDGDTNNNVIWFIVISIVVVTLGIVGYRKLVKKRPNRGRGAFEMHYSEFSERD